MVVLFDKLGSDTYPCSHIQVIYKTTLYTWLQAAVFADSTTDMSGSVTGVPGAAATTHSSSGSYVDPITSTRNMMLVAWLASIRYLILVR